MGLLDKLFGQPSRKKFAKDLIQSLKNAGDKRSVSFDSKEFRLVFADTQGQGGEMNLANLYLEYCRVEKSDRKRCMTDMVRAALSHLKEMPSNFDEASFDIRPRLWTRATFEQLQLRRRIEKGPPVNWPLEPIGDHLYLSLVYDLPESVRSLSQDDLEQWGVTYWEAREVAIRNLQECKFAYASVGGELYASNTGDSYDATRLILTELFEEFEVNGQTIAMVPNRDTLLISGTDSEVGLKMMMEFAQSQISEAPRPMTTMPLILNPDGTWTDWTPDSDHPLAAEIRRMKLNWIQVEYAEQAALLKKINEIESVDEFIGSFDILQKEGMDQSYCVWSKGVPSLLPHTDLITFFVPVTPEAPLVSDFESARNELGPMMEKLDLFPNRFRVTDFPSEEQLKKMGAKPIQ